MLTSRNNLFKKMVVLIPTINEPTLDQVVRTICQQAPEMEVMLLGYGEAGVVADKYGVGFMDFHQKTRKTVALNAAIKEVTREWIIILDADAIPEPGWAENMAKAFQAGHQIFSGSVRIITGNFWIKVYNLSLFHEFSMLKEASTRMHLPGLTLGITKQLFETNGPFLESLNRSEDYEWALRAYKNGHQLHFHPTAIVKHLAINKDSLQSVLHYWYNSGYENWLVRMMYAEILHTPYLMKSKFFILLFSPVLAIVPTVRIFSTSPQIAFRHPWLIPFIYIAKLAWCFGVFFQSKRPL